MAIAVLRLYRGPTQGSRGMFSRTTKFCSERERKPSRARERQGPGPGGGNPGPDQPRPDHSAATFLWSFRPAIRWITR